MAVKKGKQIAGESSAAAKAVASTSTAVASSSTGKRKKILASRPGKDRGGSSSKRRRSGAFQFVDDAAEEVDDDDEESDGLSLSSSSDDDDAIVAAGGSGAKGSVGDAKTTMLDAKTDAKFNLLPFFLKEEDLSGDELEEMIRERYGNTSVCLDDDSKEFDTLNASLHGMRDLPIWKVKCMVGRERHTVFCLLQKFIDLHSLGNKLPVISAFSIDNVKGHVFIEAEKESDVIEACKGFCNLYLSRISSISKDEIPRLLSAKRTSNELSPGTWVRMKSGNYKGDLGQIVAFDDQTQRAMVKLIPRVDLQALAKKFGGGESLKQAIVPSPRLISSHELEDFRPHIQSKRDRLTGEYFEILDGLMFKNGYLYKKVSVASFSLGVQPSKNELAKFEVAKKDDEDELNWLSHIFGDRKKTLLKEPDDSQETMEGSGYELNDLVLLGRKDFGVIIGIKGDGFQILKGGDEGHIITVLRKEINSKCADKMFAASDHNKKTISINDNVRVLKGSSEGKEGVVKHMYKGTLFIYDEKQTENCGFFCAKSGSCENLKKPKAAINEKMDCGSSYRAFEEPIEPRGIDSDSRRPRRYDTDSPFSVGQTLRIKVGPLKGYLCRVVRVNRSNVTVKLDSLVKILTVNCNHLSEANLKNFGSMRGDSFTTNNAFGSHDQSLPNDDGWGATSLIKTPWELDFPPSTRNSFHGASSSPLPGLGLDDGKGKDQETDPWSSKLQSQDGDHAGTSSKGCWDRETSSSGGQTGGWSTYQACSNDQSDIWDAKGKAVAGNGAGVWGKSSATTQEADGWGKVPAPMKEADGWGKAPAGTKEADDWGKAPATTEEADGWAKAPSTAKEADGWGKPLAASMEADVWGKTSDISPATTKEADAWGKVPTTTNEDVWGKPPASTKEADAWGKASVATNEADIWGNTTVKVAAATIEADAWGKVPAATNEVDAWGKPSTTSKEADAWRKPSTTSKEADAWGKSSAVTKEADAWGKPSTSSKEADAWGKPSTLSKEAYAWGKAPVTTNEGDAWGKSPVSKGLDLWDNAPAETNESEVWSKAPTAIKEAKVWGKTTTVMKEADSWSNALASQSTKNVDGDCNAWVKGSGGSSWTSSTVQGWNQKQARDNDNCWGQTSNANGDQSNKSVKPSVQGFDQSGNRDRAKDTSILGSYRGGNWANDSDHHGARGSLNPGHTSSWEKGKMSASGDFDKWHKAKDAGEGEAGGWLNAGGHSDEWTKPKSSGGEHGSGLGKGRSVNEEDKVDWGCSNNHPRHFEGGRGFGRGRGGGRDQQNSWGKSEEYDGGRGSDWGRGRGRSGAGNKNRQDSWNKPGGFGGDVGSSWGGGNDGLGETNQDGWSQQREFGRGGGSGRGRDRDLSGNGVSSWGDGNELGGGKGKDGWSQQKEFGRGGGSARGTGRAQNWEMVESRENFNDRPFGRGSGPDRGQGGHESSNWNNEKGSQGDGFISRNLASSSGNDPSGTWGKSKSFQGNKPSGGNTLESDWNNDRAGKGWDERKAATESQSGWGQGSAAVKGTGAGNNWNVPGSKKSESSWDTDKSTWNRSRSHDNDQPGKFGSKPASDWGGSVEGNKGTCKVDASNSSAWESDSSGIKKSSAWDGKMTERDKSGGGWENVKASNQKQNSGWNAEQSSTVQTTAGEWNTAKSSAGKSVEGNAKDFGGSASAWNSNFMPNEAGRNESSSGGNWDKPKGHSGTTTAGWKNDGGSWNKPKEPGSSQSRGWNRQDGFDSTGSGNQSGSWNPGQSYPGGQASGWRSDVSSDSGGGRGRYSSSKRDGERDNNSQPRNFGRGNSSGWNWDAGYQGSGSKERSSWGHGKDTGKEQSFGGGGCDASVDRSDNWNSTSSSEKKSWETWKSAADKQGSGSGTWGSGWGKGLGSNSKGTVSASDGWNQSKGIDGNKNSGWNAASKDGGEPEEGCGAKRNTSGADDLIGGHVTQKDGWSEERPRTGNWNQSQELAGSKGSDWNVGGDSCGWDSNKDVSGAGNSGSWNRNPVCSNDSGRMGMLDSRSRGKSSETESRSQPEGFDSNKGSGWNSGSAAVSASAGPCQGAWYHESKSDAGQSSSWVCELQSKADGGDDPGSGWEKKISANWGEGGGGGW